MLIHLNRLLACAVLVSILALGCKKEEEIPEIVVENFVCDQTVSYSTDIVPILEVSCAISGCHVNGFAWGSLQTYEGVADKINTLSFKVLVNMSMPPPDSNGPTELTEEELNKIDCWI